MLWLIHVLNYYMTYSEYNLIGELQQEMAKTIEKEVYYRP